MEYQKKSRRNWRLIVNKFTNRITKVLKKSETVTNENDKETPKERYTSPKEEKKIVDNLRK